MLQGAELRACQACQVRTFLLHSRYKGTAQGGCSGVWGTRDRPFNPRSIPPRALNRRLPNPRPTDDSRAAIIPLRMADTIPLGRCQETVSTRHLLLRELTRQDICNISRFALLPRHSTR